MEALFLDYLKNGLSELIEAEQQNNQGDKEDLRLVIKIEKSELGAFLFNKEKFTRKVELIELVRLITKEI
jgi:hypothetical protein